ncbi:MAG: phosphate regulon transcriptional regulatory protein PhoB [Gammaproteobacteria bacterium]|nr:MAG: phosphate regulon transcriptional regulatory protein PhoB [Gammaproteobacteria bacterium]
MKNKRILILEDDQAIREMIGFALRREGYEYIEAASASAAEALLDSQVPDLMLVDWMLPGISGVEFIRQIRKDARLADMPVIMLTARAEEDDRIIGLDSGADDYISKPFSPRELMARIRAALRRTRQEEGRILKVGSLSMDIDGHRVSCNGETFDLGPTEYKLLQFLMENPDRVYSRAQLLDHVWGHNAYVEERTIDVHVLRLRKALSPYACDKMLQTVRGAGYRFSE